MEVGKLTQEEHVAWKEQWIKEGTQGSIKA